MNQSDIVLAAAFAALIAFGGIRTIITVAKDGFGRVPTRQM